MNVLYLTFIAYRQSHLSMRVMFPSAHGMQLFYWQFVEMFPDLHESYVQSQVINLFYDAALKERLGPFLDAGKEKAPQFHEIDRFFRKLNEGDPFFILPFQARDMSPELSIRIHNYLTCHHEGGDHNELNHRYDELFSDLIQDYEIRAYGEQPINIGNRMKEKRVCRFCDNKRKPLTFKKKAHAISEGLGNKTIVLHDECDGCNEEFSKSTEQDIIEYLSFLRTFYDVKGKGGSKKIKGKNFEVSHDEFPKITYIGDGDKDIDSNLLFDDLLSSHAKISGQNVYRCLCKYLLSVVDAEDLKGFDKTIRWINGEHFGNSLPKIMTILNYKEKPSKQPILATFIRKSDKRQLPYAVGEFQFLFLRLIFIVPYCSGDDLDYSNDPDYQCFLTKFTHYDRVSDKTFFSLSDNEKKNFHIHLRIVKPEKRDE